MRMMPHSSSAAVTPGGTTTVESNCSMIAGPGDDVAGLEPLAVEDRRVDHAGALVELDRPRGDRLRVAIAPGELLGLEVGLRGDADRPQPELVDLDGRVVAPVGELALVLVVEAGDRPVERGDLAVDGDGQRAPLAEVAHRDRALQAHVLVGHALLAHALARLVLELDELGLDLARVRVRQRPQVHRRQVVAHVDEQAAERRRDARVGRDDHGRDRQLLGERGAVQRAGAAERDQREVARVIAAADRDQADGVGHVGVGDLDHRARRVEQLEPERLGHAVADRRPRPARGRASSRRPPARCRAGRARGSRRCWSAASPPRP